MKKKIVLTFISFIMIVVVGVFFTFIPKTSFDNKVEKEFFGNKSEFNGVLTCWNIDTFESGIASKSSFLQSVAIDFEKENKGVYLFVKNMTVDEFLLQLSEGNKPNIFSFGEGLFDIVKGYLSNDLLSVKVKQIIENNKDLSYAKPWCFGFYSLISTSTILEKSGNADATKLDNIIDSCSYEKKYKKSTVLVDSFVYGGAKYTDIKNIISIFSKNVEDNDYTFFQAYDKFINNKASILVGTHRDIIRMNNRVNSGKIENYIYTPILEKTDLVQYIGYTPFGDQNQDFVSKKFIDYLMSEKIQKNLYKIGMLAARNNVFSNPVGEVVGDVERKFI